MSFCFEEMWECGNILTSILSKNPNCLIMSGKKCNFASTNSEHGKTQRINVRKTRNCTEK